MMASKRGKASGRTEEMGSGTGRWFKVGIANFQFHFQLHFQFPMLKIVKMESGRHFKAGIARAAAVLIFSAVAVAGLTIIMMELMLRKCTKKWPVFLTISIYV